MLLCLVTQLPLKYCLFAVGYMRPSVEENLFIAIIDKYFSFSEEDKILVRNWRRRLLPIPAADRPAGAPRLRPPVHQCVGEVAAAG